MLNPIQLSNMNTELRGALDELRSIREADEASDAAPELSSSQVSLFLDGDNVPSALSRNSPSGSGNQKMLATVRNEKVNLTPEALLWMHEISGAIFTLKHAVESLSRASGSSRVETEAVGADHDALVAEVSRLRADNARLSRENEQLHFSAITRSPLPGCEIRWNGRQWETLVGLVCQRLDSTLDKAKDAAEHNGLRVTNDPRVFLLRGSELVACSYKIVFGSRDDAVRTALHHGWRVIDDLTPLHYCDATGASPTPTSVASTPDAPAPPFVQPDDLPR